MLQLLRDQFRGFVSVIIFAVNTIFFSLMLYLLALLKLVFPFHGWRILCGKAANTIAQGWVGVNGFGLKLTKNIRWDVQGIDSLRPDKWYLLVANHQSMVDIAVLQEIFHRKIPMLKFFLKQELIWVPFLGIVWWTLDFPFMKRTSSARKDIETARKACDKFRMLPVTITDFVEGTRFNEAKREEQNSPFTYLLKPKPGGMAVVLCTLGRCLDSILDVTIVYPKGIPGFWKFLCSNSIEIRVRVKRIPIEPELLGDYLTDRGFRRDFKEWLDKLWEEKDKLIGTLHRSPDRISNREEL